VFCVQSAPRQGCEANKDRSGSDPKLLAPSPYLPVNAVHNAFSHVE